MPRRCSICQNVKREEIDLAILEGQTFRRIATEFSVSVESLRRHKRNGHVSRKILKTKEAEEIAEGETLIRKIQDLELRAKEILDRADLAKNGPLALSAIREIREVLKLYGMVSGQLQEQTVKQQVNIFLSPEFLIIREILMSELSGYPDVRARIAQRLIRAEVGNGNDLSGNLFQGDDTGP